MALLSVGYLSAQISHGGQPLAFDDSRNLGRVDFLEVVPQDLTQLRAEDEVNDQHKDIPFRFGANISVQLSLEDGEWQDIDGGSIWQMGISSPGAKSLNFTFSTFNIPLGAQLFVYNSDKTEFLGSFTHENMQPHGGLGVSLIHSDEIILEYFEPAKVAGQGVLEIDQVTHGYREVVGVIEEIARGPFGNSGSCNINVACEEGIGWEDQIRSVSVIVVGGNGICTGSLVNNTAEDGTPYFLTANHCLGGSVANWVFYFNHESMTCGGNTGPTNQSVSGAQIRASNSGSDFALLELNSEPPSSFDVFYNGWDRTGNDPSATTCIHHPGGDIKKITHDFDGAYQSVDNGAQTWFIDQWEEGTTEPGSSGSPLYDQNGRVIGQLYGGAASCTNDSYDFYGRFDVSWDGSSASNRLRDWLDPQGSNPEVLDGFGGAPLVANDAGALGVTGLDAVFCNEQTATPSFTLRNNGLENLTSVTIEIEFNGVSAGTIDWTGDLATGETELITLPLLTLQDGANTLVISLIEPNGEVDGNPGNNVVNYEFSAFIDAFEYLMTLELDQYGSETTWEVSDENGNILYSGGPYEDSFFGDPEVVDTDLCLGEGCYTFTIYDDFGDGICCEYGEGSFTLYDDEGAELTTGGTFTNEELFDFCVTPTSVGESVKNPFGLELFPNPSNEYFTINLSVDISDYDLLITDITGRVIVQEQGSGSLQNRVVKTADWSPGVYLVRLSNGKSQELQRVVISR